MPNKGKGRGKGRGRGDEIQQGSGARGRGEDTQGPGGRGSRPPGEVPRQQPPPGLGQRPGPPQGQRDTQPTGGPPQRQRDTQPTGGPPQRQRDTQPTAGPPQQPPPAWGQRPPAQTIITREQPIEGKKEQRKTTATPLSIVPSSKSRIDLLLEDVLNLKISKGSKNKMAKRPGFGLTGRPIDLITNYFLIQHRDVSIFHYDVDIVYLRSRKKDGVEESKGAHGGGETYAKGKSIMQAVSTAQDAVKRGESHLEHEQKRAPGKQRCREVIREMIKKKEYSACNPVYDGQKNIYTTKKLPFEKKTKLTVSLDEGHRFVDFEVSIQPVEKQSGTGNRIEIEMLQAVLAGKSNEIPYDVIMAYETVLCHRLPPFKQVQVGRSFFKLDQRPTRLGEGVEIWFGYNQSVHLTHRGPAVIVNFSAKAFHKAGPVLDYVSDVLNCDITRLNTLNPKDIHLLNEALKKIKVEVTHMKRGYRRKYAVKNVANVTARNHRFSVDGKKEVTMIQYFKDTYNLQIRYPDLPCLLMKSGTGKTYLPMEVCEVVPHQPVMGKLSGRLTAEMIKKTAIPPAERFEKIKKEKEELRLSSGEMMKNFGLASNYQLMEVPGRVLQPPVVAYAGSQNAQQSIRPDPKGTWRIENMQFFKSQEKCSWMLMSFANQRFCSINDLENLASILCQTGRKLGLGLERASDIRALGPNHRLDQALQHAKHSGVKFAVVVLSPNDTAHSYDELKFIADIQLRLVTQCIKDSNVRRFNPNVATNVLLKINSKIGGVNHSLLHRPVIFSRPAIIFGADAAHSPRGFACPSIAAVVGSLDAFPSQYAVSCRVQENPDSKKISQEIILDMKDMVKSILTSFTNNTRGKYPEKILFFRDGVSEGQFKTVLETEVPLIQQACNEALNGNIPPMTYIVVQKRHQTRFMPKNPRDGVGRMGNIPPGTVVDKDITHPVFYDFFICSHEGIQGTSKPAHYTVLFDENHFKVDELQQLCYHLCHMYARCNRSISIPPPVMYADLACTRAKKYAELHLNRDAHSTVSSGSSGRQPLPPEAEKAINQLMGTFDARMFYV